MKTAEKIKQQNMEALAEYLKTMWTKPKMRLLFFELTDTCNLNCMHCGSRCTSSNHTFLPYEEIIKVLDRVAGVYSPSKIMVCITGGEPMLHPDMIKVISESKKRGFRVGITTNGVIIDDKSAQKMADAGLDTCAISIDGLYETHDSFRGSSGAFERAMRGIRNLKKHGVNSQPVTCVHKGNIGQLEEMYEYFRSEGIDSWRITNVDPIGRAQKHSDILLDGDELKILYDFIRDKRFDAENDMEITYGCSHFLTFEYEHMVRDFYFQCDAGTRNISVAANGDIVACLDIERRSDLVQGNIYKDDIIDVWENRFEIFRQNRAETSKTCKSCKYSGICMGDSAHTWDYTNNEPLYCIANKWGK